MPVATSDDVDGEMVANQVDGVGDSRSDGNSNGGSVEGGDGGARHCANPHPLGTPSTPPSCCTPLPYHPMGVRGRMGR
ncbi:hypothetical protein V1477_014293 [Vespula maculifrons]|uniref:Uncharacterized protein n=1 Tax=Vespula maculifrons TaxID=7453 RepID=A0ABD2BKM3_VESMC